MPWACRECPAFSSRPGRIFPLWLLSFNHIGSNLRCEAVLTPVLGEVSLPVARRHREPEGAGRMRIIDQRSVQSLSSVRNARGGAAAGGARFTLDQGSPTAKAEGAAPAAILGGLEALIAIQSEDTTKERRRRIVRRGQGLLDLLDELKIALLAGSLPADLQARLSIAMRDESFSGDPRLDSILEGIDLRAAVELAKLRKASRG